MKILLLLLLVLQTKWAYSDICHKHLKTLAARQMDFVQCSTLHSVPVRLCIGCEPEYSEMAVSFIVFKENCTKEYFDTDRINIISTMQSILTGLWSKAYCDDCFTSNNSANFENRSVLLKECLENFKKTECASCLGEYMELNRFYTNLDKTNNGQVCYDMQDSMNRTRHLWSQELKCCRRESNMTLFLVAISIVGCLPVVFYTGTYALTLRRERNHAILNTDPEFDADEVASATSTTAIVAPQDNLPPLSTSRQNKHKQLANDETDSDDDESDEVVNRKKL